MAVNRLLNGSRHRRLLTNESVFQFYRGQHVRSLTSSASSSGSSGTASGHGSTATRLDFELDNDHMIQQPSLSTTTKFASLGSASLAVPSFEKSNICTVSRRPVLPYPSSISSLRSVPAHIQRPPYAHNGIVPLGFPPDYIPLHNSESAERMRRAARLARQALEFACHFCTQTWAQQEEQQQHGAAVVLTTDDVDAALHEFLLERNAYPSPLNYSGFPKSVCTSINEIICHGIPDSRPLQFGDVLSLDVSCFLNGVHGDNCATIIIGDYEPGQQTKQPNSTVSAVDCDWRGVPYRTTFHSKQDSTYFEEARRLVRTTHESLHAAIQTCRPGSCISEIGHAIETVADREGFSSVRKYRGHGISQQFHCAPFIKHYRNNDRLILQPGMIFTIEPMLVQGSPECFEWEDDNWTVATVDEGLASQFEHTILITEDGAEILTASD